MCCLEVPHFAFLLGNDNSHATPQKVPPGEEGLLWGWCVVGGPLRGVPHRGVPQKCARGRASGATVRSGHAQV